MSDWHEARVASISPAAEGLVRVRLDVPLAVAASHSVPGQYVKVTLDGAAESFFAIASRPDPRGEQMELLLKLGSPVTDAIARLLPGEVVRTSAAQGKGFPIDRAAGRDLLLVATGSGISPVRSVIETVRADRPTFGHVTLIFGARTPAAFAYRDDFDAWHAAQIKVFPVVSRPVDATWTGLTGYVQAHLGGIDLSRALAFLCGQKTMVEAVRKALAERGMPLDAMLLNF